MKALLAAVAIVTIVFPSFVLAATPDCSSVGGSVAQTNADGSWVCLIQGGEMTGDRFVDFNANGAETGSTITNPTTGDTTAFDQNGQVIPLPTVNVEASAATGNTGFVALKPAPAGSQVGDIYAQQSLPGYLNAVFRIIISIGAMAAVIQIVRAGYMYMISGVGSFASQSKAKEIIGNAVMGLLLLLSVYLILFQINPCILNLSILSFKGNGTTNTTCPTGN